MPTRTVTPTRLRRLGVHGRAIACALASILLARSVLAHDQWIEPAVTPGSSGARADARLVVGEAPFGDDEKPFERAKLSRLELWSRNGRTDLLSSGIAGAKPLASVTGLGRGEFLFVLDRTPVLIELEPAKFESYLTGEGLSAVVKERASRGESMKPGRERYTRYAKGLLHVGLPAAQGMAVKVLGQKLEIVVDGGHVLRAGEPFAARVTFDGRPLAGARVQASVRREGAVNADAGALESAGATDARGGVTLTVASSGFLVLHLVHMRRCVDPDGAPCREADWESFWGSFSAPVY